MEQEGREPTQRAKGPRAKCEQISDCEFGIVLRARLLAPGYFPLISDL